MNTFDLQQAAAFLGLHPVTLQQRAKAGLIPGAKIGKEWRFLDVDLVAYLRAQYAPSQSQPQPCQKTASTSGKAVRIGTRLSGSTDSDFAAVHLVNGQLCTTMMAIKMQIDFAKDNLENLLSDVSCIECR